MKKGQKGIYWISGELKKAVAYSPMLEVFRQERIEVLFLMDPINEYSFQQLKDYNDHKLIFITKENYEIDEAEYEKAAFEAAKESLKRLKESSKGSLEKIVKRFQFPRD
jgi:molecular chaperone HtpG